MHKGLLRTFFVGSLFVCFALSADAQATRTWVSGVGDDVNPCSRTAPCKTFAGAISKTAANGEINCLDPAGYGAVTITKAVTIDCSGTLGGILGAGTNGIIINISSDTSDFAKTVRIRGISLNGAATGINGIKILAASKVFVENSVIDGFTGSGILAENTGSTQLTVSRSVIRNNGSGISAAPKESAEVFVSESLIAGNGVGLQASGNSTIRIAGSTVGRNATGLSAVNKGAIISFGNNAIGGNITDGSPTSTTALK